VLVAAERLLIRIRQVPSRADELIELRRRLREAHAEPAGDDERALAREVRERKQRLSAALSSVTSCARCAAGRRWPRGAFDGGDCCSAVTADLFAEDEVAALAQAGTRPHHLRAPRGVHPGCAFRGPTGCTLRAADRPVRCVRYTCMLLRRELRERGELAAIDVLRDELQQAMDRFVALRRARLDEELLAPLEHALRVAHESGRGDAQHHLAQPHGGVATRKSDVSAK
jgi:hypothetical protein